jgi:RND family efflux transporter MFP subunit
MSSLLHVAVLASAFAAAGCSRPAPTAAPPQKAAPAAASRLVEPERIRFAPRIVATGTLEAREASPLAMAVPGIVARIAVERGDDVKQGVLLLALDSGAAAAGVAQAEAGVQAARAQLSLAEDALARVTRIRGEEGASEAQAFQAKAQRDLAAAQLAASEAQLRRARVGLDHHFLRAPFAGLVTHIPEGTGITVGAGTPLVTLLSTGALVLRTSLTQEEAAEVRTGTRAAVHVPATGARTEEAVVGAVVAAVDAQTNRVPVEIAVPNGDGRFLPNAHARAELPRGTERDAWRVPASSLVQREGGLSVWVAGADGKARALAVRLLAEEGDAAVVAPSTGWPEGLRVVARPPLGIAEGALVAEAVR